MSGPTTAGSAGRTHHHTSDGYCVFTSISTRSAPHTNTQIMLSKQQNYNNFQTRASCNLFLFRTNRNNRQIYHNYFPGLLGRRKSGGTVSEQDIHQLLVYADGLVVHWVETWGSRTTVSFPVPPNWQL